MTQPTSAMEPLSEAMIEAGAAAIEEAEDTPFLNPPNRYLAEVCYRAMEAARTPHPTDDDVERVAVLTEGRRMFILAAAILERDVLLSDLTEDEMDVLVSAVLNATDRASDPQPADDAVERAARAIWAEHRYHYEPDVLTEFGSLETQHCDDQERATRQARAAIAALASDHGVERGLVELLREAKQLILSPPSGGVRLLELLEKIDEALNRLGDGK